ncbi:uncharacterized protein JN550_000485 [Neoarthrinium moseri]|uniref:uncharacterized protein n=1 Tax=Neoarthrinium moseri TaxID=1658444 RepID=UPI001FDB3929|nr:uncharacterized protein JN550_000485 [Neoarthrinium moseri]KAI1878303.1 hypothetical protein JN550_000485 [Neoarthrinium moseri]
MADDSFSTQSTAHTTGRVPFLAGNAGAPSNAPPGYGMRRAATMDEAANFRRRPSYPSSAGNSFTRRNSNLSDISFEEPEDDNAGIWNLGRVKTNPPDKDSYASIPLVLALLPAVGGLFFEGGSAFFTDIILLGLAAIFLRWSVTQPWNWLHAAQEIRVVKEMAMATSVFETDSDGEPSIAASATTALENVPEEDEKEPEASSSEPPRSPTRQKWEAERDAAAKELRFTERIALFWCFAFPLLGAYLLHTIRGQLSQRSEGLVCDYNLCIFVIAAEIRPVAHLIRAIQGRTLRKQRIVAANPYEHNAVRDQQFQELHSKMEELEARLAASETLSVATAETEQTTTRTLENLVMRNYRDKVQPEVDSVTRAMRRYEKKLSNIVNQIDIRLEYLDQRNSDAIALAAVAARQKNSERGIFAWLVDNTASIFMFPVRTTIAVLMFPFRTISSLLGRTSRPLPEKSYKRDRRTMKHNSDRVTSRVSRR